MNILKIKEIKNLNLEDINSKIIETQHELFNLKFKQATRQTVKTHLFKKYKKMLAQLLTIENIKKQ